MNKLIICLLAAFLLLIVFQLDDLSTETSTKGVSVNEVLGDSNSEGFEFALEPITFNFPADHGPHNNFKNEWWYITGNLYDENNDRYGFQITFFRQALKAMSEQAQGENWKSPQVYLAHFAMSNLRDNTFFFNEKLTRPGGNVVTIEQQPLAISIDSWTLEATEESFFPLRLYANYKDTQLELELTSAKPMVLQGDRGLSQKNEIPGNASYYYSFTRLVADGRITQGKDVKSVVGSAWLDREWSSSALSDEQVGWDWFALQFSNSSEMMFYQLRNKDGSTSPFSKGVLVNSEGIKQALSTADIKLTPVNYWQSENGQRYPIEWQIDSNLPLLKQAKLVKAIMPNQYLETTIQYWEGAVDILDSTGNPLGVGFLEMTGY